MTASRIPRSSEPGPDCARVHGQLALFVGGDLEGEERARVFRHLGECASCRGEYRVYAECREQLAGAGLGRVPHGAAWVDERFFAGLAADSLARVSAEASAPRRFALAAMRRPILVAACAGLLLALGVYGYRWSSAGFADGLTDLPGRMAIMPRTPAGPDPMGTQELGHHGPAPARRRHEGLTPSGWGLLGRQNLTQTLELSDDLLRSGSDGR